MGGIADRQCIFLLVFISGVKTKVLHVDTIITIQLDIFYIDGKRSKTQKDLFSAFDTNYFSAAFDFERVQFLYKYIWP